MSGNTSKKVMEYFVADGPVLSDRVCRCYLRQIDVMWGLQKTLARRTTFRALEERLGNQEPPDPVEIPFRARTILDLLPGDAIGGRRFEPLSSLGR